MSINEISKNVDTVLIEYKEFQKIIKWAKTQSGALEVEEKAFFPFKTFVLKIYVSKHETMTTLIELDTFMFFRGGRISFDEYSFTYKRDSVRKGFQFDGTFPPSSDPRYTKEEGVERVHSLIMLTLIYIYKFARARVTRVSPQITRQEREDYEYKERELFLLNDIVKYVSIHPNKSSIKYRCEVWGVRGHLRHYKDGKVVFIKPYKKGTKKDILEPKSKTYLLKGGDDLCDT